MRTLRDVAGSMPRQIGESMPRRLGFIASTLAYLAVFHWGYHAVSAWQRGSAGVTMHIGSPLALAGAMVAAALPALWLPTDVRRPSHLVLVLLYLLAYVPSMLVPEYIVGHRMDVVPFRLALAVGFVIASATLAVPTLRLPTLRLGAPVYRLLLVALALGSAAFMVAVFGLPTEIPGIAGEERGDVRQTFVARLGGVRTLAGYLVPWAGYVVFPLLLLVGVRARNAALIALALVGELLVYATTGFRATVLLVVLLAFVYVVLRYFRQAFGTVVLLTAVAGIAALTLGQVWLGLALPAEILFTRLLVLPGQLVAYYVEFFSANPTYLLSHSVLGWFVEMPYELEPPQLIGATYFGSAEVFANANLWADAFANFGLAGVVAFSVLLAVVLVVIDTAAANRDLLVTAPLFAISTVALANAGLLTSLLTLGIGLAIVLVGVMPLEAEASAEAEPRYAKSPGLYSVE